MRKKNLILLTSITGLFLTLTPSQALAQESITPTTSSSSQDSSDKKNDDNIRLASEDKCHWNNEIPVPENKYLKLLYDYGKKIADDNQPERPEALQELVDNGDISEKEAQYREQLLKEVDFKNQFQDVLSFTIQYPLNTEYIKDIINETYNNPDNIDEMVKEIIDSFSLKEYLEYVEDYKDFDNHVIYSTPELYNKYKEEFNELDKVIDYENNNDIDIWGNVNNFKVNKLLDSYDSDEEQIQRFSDLHYWLEQFPDKENFENSPQNIKWRAAYTTMLTGISFTDLYQQIKDKGLDNDEFYNEVKDYLKKETDMSSDNLTEKLFEYGIDWSRRVSSKLPARHYWKLEKLINNPDLEIPYIVECDEEETPGEDTPTSDTPTNPETPGDKETTTPTTKTTSKQDKPSTKTSTKSSDKSTTTTTSNNEDKEDKEDNSTTTASTTTPITPNQVKTPGKVNTPNNPNNPGQSFTPVNNTNPGTFNGGVSSSVEGEEISEGSTVDTGSPTISILNKIRTIF